MEVIAWSQNLTAEKARRAAPTLVSKEELFRQSDFVSVHLMLGARTRGLVGARRSRADEADRVPDQHLARADRRRGGAARRARAAQIAGAGLDYSTSSRCRPTTRFASSTTSC